MTEAQVMSTPPSFLDLAQASSFCSEMLALVPENLIPTAYKALEYELQPEIHTFPDDRLYDLLKSISSS